MSRLPPGRVAVGRVIVGRVTLGEVTMGGVTMGGVTLGLLLLAGCTATRTTGQVASLQTSAPAVSSQVTGRFVMDGGPMGPGGQQPGERPIPGTVTFTAAGHRPVSVTVTASGRFSLRLSPGEYQVAGRSPSVETITGSGQAGEQTCSQPGSVTVIAGHVA